MYLTSARFDWCSDYSQFYLWDAGTTDAAWLESIPQAAFEAGYFVGPHALVVYTQDCLRQIIEIMLHDSPPQAEPDLTPVAWTKRAQTTVTLPSQRFVVTSPSGGARDLWGPLFMTPAPRLVARIDWREDETVRYETERLNPDHIRVTLWPAP